MLRSRHQGAADLQAGVPPPPRGTADWLRQQAGQENTNETYSETLEFSTILSSFLILFSYFYKMKT